MQSGKLRSYISYQESTDGTWATVKSVWVGTDYQSGSETTDPEMGREIENVRLRMRRDTSITSKGRFLYEGRELYIQAVLPDRTDRRNQICDCVQEEM